MACYRFLFSLMLAFAVGACSNTRHPASAPPTVSTDEIGLLHLGMIYFPQSGEILASGMLGHAQGGYREAFYLKGELAPDASLADPIRKESVPLHCFDEACVHFELPIRVGDHELPAPVRVRRLAVQRLDFKFLKTAVAPAPPPGIPATIFFPEALQRMLAAGPVLSDSSLLEATYRGVEYFGLTLSFPHPSSELPHWAQVAGAYRLPRMSYDFQFGGGVGGGPLEGRFEKLGDGRYRLETEETSLNLVAEEEATAL